jgi:hypothetical protein
MQTGCRIEKIFIRCFQVLVKVPDVAKFAVDLPFAVFCKMAVIDII